MSETSIQTADKELLTLAARAAGYTLEEHYDDDQYYPWCAETEAFWNSLLDDGDALRLAVKLGLTVEVLSKRMEPHTRVNGKEEEHRNDSYAATRRAIVRAAAEIGKEM